MDGFKLTKESFTKPVENKFWELNDENKTAEEKQLNREQLDREMWMSVEESVAVDEKIKKWKENPALSKNVMAVVPKKSVFLGDELDIKQQEQLEALKKEYTGTKLDRKTASLKKNINKQKESRKKAAMDIAKKSLSQGHDLEEWENKHVVKLYNLSGKKKDKYIAGLVGKMQDFVDKSLFLGNMDSDAGIMKAFEKVLKAEKDYLRLKADSTYFSTQIDEKLLMDFSAKYASYTALSSFLQRLVVKMAQGKKRTAADLSEINSILGENVLIKGTATEKIFTDSTKGLQKGETLEQKKEKLKNSLNDMDIEAERQEIKKNNVFKVQLVNESKNLKETTRQIQEKWEKQGEETPVFDKDGKPVMTEKLNPKDYGVENGGEWKPFLDNAGNPVMIQKTEAKNRDALRKKLKEQTERIRFQGFTKKELEQKMSTCSDEEYKHYEAIYTKGTSEMETHITGYSGETFKVINNALRYGKYGKVKLGGGEGYWNEDVKTMVEDLKNDISNELPDELCLTRHGDLGGLAAMFGLSYNSVKNVEDLMERIGNLPDNGFLIRDKAFMSTTLIKDGVAQGGFRQAQVEFRILAPKGTKGLYIEEMSLYPDTEQELILDAGTIFRVTKIDATGKWDSDRATEDNNKKVIVYMEAIPKKKSA